MDTLVSTIVVLLVGGASSAACAAAFGRGLPPFGTALSMAASIVIGYLMAGIFFQWRAADAVVKRRLVFPGVVALLSAVGAFIGPGPPFARAFGASLVPAHAGMSAWFLGLIASTVVIAVASRFVDRLVARRRGNAAPTEGARSAPGAVRTTAGPSWEVSATRGAGVILLLLLMVGHGIAGPMIFRRFGPDASYQSAIGSIVRSVVYLAPLLTIAGFVLEKITRGRGGRRLWISTLLIVVALVAAGEVAYRYGVARDSDEAHGWIEYHGSRR